jgi:hypothetical protein
VPDASTSKISSGTSRTTASDSPAAAAAFVRACCEASGEDRAAPGKRISQRQALIDWAVQAGLQAESFATEALEPIRPGAEHSVFYDRQADTVIKLTHPGSFGWSTAGEGLKATPLEYLERLAWQNLLFSDDVRMVAVVGDPRILRVVTSQPYIFEDENAPDITLDEIDQFFESRHLEKVSLNPEAPWFFNADLGIVIGDANPGNFVRDVNGEIVPIDLVIGKPGEALREKVRQVFGVDLMDSETRQ